MSPSPLWKVLVRVVVVVGVVVFACVVVVVGVVVVVVIVVVMFKSLHLAEICTLSNAF